MTNENINVILDNEDSLSANVSETGARGNGISSIEKTSTSGLVDTYTITYTNGNTTTFNVTNGNGIDRIEKTATVGNKDTYTIYFTNGSTTTYEVSNGEVTREELEEEVERLSMIYNAFPSTTGEVEEGSINGTAEVPFKEIGLKGNTSQNGEPTPDTPIPVNVVTGDNEVIVSNEDNTQSQTYPINLGSMELCKIGDYQDSIKKSSGKNLAEEKISNANVYSDGRLLAGDYDIYIAKIEQNKTYTVSTNDSQFNAGFFTTKPEIGSATYDNSRVVQTSKTFTAPITGYIAFRTNSGYQFAMINEGSTALPYEPYGKVWYKYGAIGKVVLDGSESWSDFSVGDTNFRCQYDVALPNILTPPTNPAQLFSNYFKAINRDNAYAKTEIGIAQYGSTLGKVFICAPNIILSEQTLASWKNWLSEHNTTLYYVLNTPTITEITDTTLIEQLDNLEKAYSYDTQTNISQANQDKPFIISYEAILSLKNVLNNLETRIAVLETE